MIDNVNTYVFPAAFALLPGVMDTGEARAMLLAIGLQESEFEARRQGGNGPARGFWQFEKGGGVNGVLTHFATQLIVKHVCGELLYAPEAATCHAAIEHNDTLACCFARLLLWTLPGMLPQRGDLGRSWAAYDLAWRPGKPRPADWPKNYKLAWSIIAP